MLRCTECVSVIRIKTAEKQYVDAFEDEIAAFRGRVKLRAREKIEAAMKEAEEVRERGPSPSFSLSLSLPSPLSPLPLLPLPLFPLSPSPSYMYMYIVCTVCPIYCMYMYVGLFL